MVDRLLKLNVPPMAGAPGYAPSEYVKIEVHADNSVALLGGASVRALGEVLTLWELGQHTVVIRQRTFPNQQVGPKPNLDQFWVFAIMTIEPDDYGSVFIDGYPVVTFDATAPSPAASPRGLVAYPAPAPSGEDNKPDAWDTFAAQHPAPKEA